MKELDEIISKIPLLPKCPLSFNYPGDVTGRTPGPETSAGLIVIQP